MKNKPVKRVKLKGWAIVGNNGEWWDKVSTIMGPNLRKMYGKSKFCQIVPCEISYQLKAPRGKRAK